jgi:hypothetical protein
MSGARSAAGLTSTDQLRGSMAGLEEVLDRPELAHRVGMQLSSQAAIRGKSLIFPKAACGEHRKPRLSAMLTVGCGRRVSRKMAALNSTPAVCLR